MAGFTFEAVLIRPEGVGTWTFLNIPEELSSTFGSKGQVKVKGTINGYPFRSTALPMGDGTHYLVVAKDIRGHIAVSPGDTVRVTMELDPEQRVVEIPDDLLEALLSQPEAKERFEKMPYSHQKEYVSWIVSAKRVETRQRRIEQAIARIFQGNKLRG
jgi:hypothetical protein